MVVDATSTLHQPATKGRSLWADAWRRLKANKAAVVSGVYLILMTLVCVVGPYFSMHSYDAVYPDFVKVPASLEAYPTKDMIEPNIKDALSRGRMELVEWERDSGRILVTAKSDRELDERYGRYLARASSFKDVKLEALSDDKKTAVFSAQVQELYFFFGTDPNGRDLLTRTLIAGRISLSIGLLAGLVALLIGVTYGAIAGFVGGRTDNIMMRIVDILYSLPFIFFVIMLVVFFGRNFVLMFIAVGAVLWLDMARIVRGQTLTIKAQEYVTAAGALGVSQIGILWRHVIPNTLGPVVVFVTLLVPHVIILESFLSFLGLGVQEPLTSWGVLISQGARNIPGSNWLLFFPSFFLTTTLFALNFIGDGLRDALDPKDR
ncbi:MAG: ABC transporter permease subunit [Pseudomonadota bacterium]